jgi:uncharacterized protein YjbI with pentapeptide repeats
MSTPFSLPTSTNSIVGNRMTFFYRLLALTCFIALAAPASAATNFGLDIVHGAQCIGCDMHGRDFHGRDMHGQTYIGTDMKDTDFRNADLHGAKFIGVDLTGARLDGADLRNASFTGTDFSGTTFAGAKLDGVKLTGADLRRAQLAGVVARQLLARCIGCDFSRSDLHGIDFHDTALIGDDFHGANLEHANFNGATLCVDGGGDHCSDFRDARVDGADFRNVRWCDRNESTCRTATADELRRYGHNAFTNAILP